MSTVPESNMEESKDNQHLGLSIPIQPPRADANSDATPPQSGSRFVDILGCYEILTLIAFHSHHCDMMNLIVSGKVIYGAISRTANLCNLIKLTCQSPQQRRRCGFCQAPLCSVYPEAAELITAMQKWQPT